MAQAVWTGVYWPKDYPVNNAYGAVGWYEGDFTHIYSNAWNEGPSYCVRLIVFEMPND
jgi:hypothetical protein